jgi:hypothetical protein
LNAPPIVSFGDPETAEVATLGLNPSDIEYQSAKGGEWTGDDRRLETLSSLGITGLEEASNDHVQRVYKGCKEYFDRNPYRKWFDQLDDVLKGVGVSYYDRSAVHLDLVQWATSEKWGDLHSEAKATMLKNDVPFLKEQLEQGQYRFLLINGRGVLNAFQDAFEASFESQGEIERDFQPTQMYVGELDSGTRVIAWSTNLQSSFGVSNDLRDTIRDRVAELA